MNLVEFSHSRINAGIQYVTLKLVHVLDLLISKCMHIVTVEIFDPRNP